MKEMIKSIFATVNSRLTNPFFGSFIVAWCAFNWKIILVLLSGNLPNVEKIDYINTNYLVNNYWYGIPTDTILWPFFTALIMSVLLPILYFLIEYPVNIVDIRRLENSEAKVKAKTRIDNLEDFAKAIDKLNDKLLQKEEEIKNVKNNWKTDVENKIRDSQKQKSALKKDLETSLKDYVELKSEFIKKDNEIIDISANQRSELKSLEHKYHKDMEEKGGKLLAYQDQITELKATISQMGIKYEKLEFTLSKVNKAATSTIQSLEIKLEEKEKENLQLNTEIGGYVLKIEELEKPTTLLGALHGKDRKTR